MNTKTPEEMLKQYYEYHKNNVIPDANWATWEKCVEDGTVNMVIDAMRAYHVQFQEQAEGWREAEVLDWLLKYEEYGVNIIIADGDYYWKNDNEGENPMNGKEVYEIFKQFKLKFRAVTGSQEGEAQK